MDHAAHERIEPPAHQPEETDDMSELLLVFIIGFLLGGEVGIWLTKRNDR